MAARDTVNRVFRDFNRYTGDGLPGEPTNAPLPTGDPSSGVHSPKKSGIRAAMLETLAGGQSAADEAEEFRDQAEAFRDQAEGYAAGLNLPDIGSGDAGKALVVNGAEAGYELVELPAPPAPVVVSTDGTLAGNSDAVVPSEKAVKTYVDGKSAGSGHSNPIINGDMTVRQNGPTVAAAPDGTQVFDHWTYNKIGAVVHTVTESTDVPTLAQSGRLFTKSLKLTLTTPDNAIAASDECVISHKIEGSRFRDIAQREQAFGFWCKPPVAGIYPFSFRNELPAAPPDLSCVVPLTVTVPNVWQWLQGVMPATPAAGTWCYDNSRAGLRMGFVAMAGSTFLAPAPNTWATGYHHTIAGAVNACQTGATELLVVGFDMWPADGVPNQPRAFEEELALCRRIRRRYSGLPNNTMILTGVATSASSAQFAVEGMRILSGASFSGTPKIRQEGVGASGVSSMAVVGTAEGLGNLNVICGGGLTTGAVVTLCVSGTSDWIDVSGEF